MTVFEKINQEIAKGKKPLDVFAELSDDEQMEIYREGVKRKFWYKEIVRSILEKIKWFLMRLGGYNAR